MCDRLTDRPTDRVDESSSITCLPRFQRESDPPAPGGFFALWKRTRAGLPPLPPSLPPKSMGRRLIPPAWSPGRLSGGGRGEREKAQPERAKRTKSFRAAGSEPQRKLKDSRKLREENRRKSRDKSGSLDPLQPPLKPLVPVSQTVFLGVSIGVS